MSRNDEVEALRVETSKLRDRVRSLEGEVSALTALYAKLSANLPATARSLTTEAVRELRKRDPYTTLEVLQDWQVASSRVFRGTMVRLDLYIHLEDWVSAGLLVGIPSDPQSEIREVSDRIAREKKEMEATRKAAAADLRRQADNLDGGKVVQVQIIHEAKSVTPTEEAAPAA